MNSNEYMKNYMVQKRKENRIYVKQKLGNVCVRCGATENLDVDHIDRTTKEFTVADMMAHSRAKIDKEIAKCQLLCEPCHIIKTKEYGDITSGGLNKIIDPPYGTAVMYGVHKCKCDLCKRWKRLYRMKLVDSLGRPKSNT